MQKLHIVKYFLHCFRLDSSDEEIAMDTPVFKAAIAKALDDLLVKRRKEGRSEKQSRKSRRSKGKQIYIYHEELLDDSHLIP
jgi:hypothetical protein